MNRTYKLLKFKAKVLAYLTLIGILIYVVAGRVVLSQLDEYRLSLQTYLSEELEVPVKIDKLSAKWSGFDPILEATGISLNGAPNAHVASAQIRLAFLASIADQAPRIKEIRLDTTHLHVHQDSAGGWSVAGVDLSDLSLSDDASSYDFQIEDVLNGTNLKLVDAYVHVTASGEDDQVWRLPSSSLRYVDGRVFAQGNVIRPDGLQPLVRFVYNSSDVNGSDGLPGDLFIEARSASFLDRLLVAYSWQGLSIQEVDASARAWVKLQGISVESVYADIQLHNMNWTSKAGSLAPITKGNISVSWHGNQHGNRVDIHNLDYDWRGDTCAMPGATIDAAAGAVNVAISRLDLRCTTELLLSLGLVEGRLAQRLSTSNPLGYLTNAHISLGETVEDFSFSSQLEHVSLAPFEGTPGVVGVNGYIQTTAEKGYIDFVSDQFELFFPNLYLKSWASNDTRGRVGWRQDGRDFVVESDSLYIGLKDDSAVFGDFNLRLNDEQHEDYLGLMLGMKGIGLDKVNDFVPFYVVDESLYEWLDLALVSGEVVDGMYFAYGSLEDDSPDHSFTSSLSLRASNAQLAFDEAWPALENLDIDLSLHEDRLLVSSNKATIQGAAISSLSVIMPGVSAENPEPKLDVKASVVLSGNDYDYWLEESAIADSTSGVADLLAFSGPSKAQLSLSLGLGETLDTQFSIDVEAQGLDVSHKDSHLSASNVVGTVSVDSESGVHSDLMTMAFMGAPGQLTITPKASSDSTEVLIDAEFDMAQLDPDSDWDFGLEGRAKFNARVDIPNDAERVTNAVLKSNLEGVVSTWPAPFDKVAALRDDLNIVAQFKPKQANVRVGLKGSALPEAKGEFLFIDGALEYGKLAFGADGRDSNLHDYAFSQDGLGITVEAGVSSLEPWIDYISQELPSSDGRAGMLKEIRVRSAEVDAFGQTVLDVETVIVPKIDSTVIQLSGPNAQGEVLITDGVAPLAINLKYLKLEEPVESSTKDAAPIDPRGFVSTSVLVEDFRWGNKDWGKWSFWTDSDEYGLVFRELQGQAHGSVFDGQLSWQYDKGHSHTILTLDAQGEDVEPILAIFDQVSPLSSEAYNAELAIVWPKSPHEFKLSDVSGSVLMSFEDGTISTDNQATGILRLFGVFNVDALMRRLRLDFSDLYRSGISYDEMRFNAVMDQGDLSFVEPLVITGPSSNYTLSGTVNLPQQQLDLKMLVELPISSNVPIAGLVLGNPAIGGAVWLVDKILGEPLSQLSTVGYTVTGNWDAPEMKLEKAINAK